MNTIAILTNEHKFLDISVNLARISDWIFSDNSRRQQRVDQFLEEIQEYIETIHKDALSSRFRSTYQQFEIEFTKLLKERSTSNKADWAERALTWANILQHRAKLA